MRDYMGHILHGGRSFNWGYEYLEVVHAGANVYVMQDFTGQVKTKRYISVKAIHRLLTKMPFCFYRLEDDERKAKILLSRK